MTAVAPTSDRSESARSSGTGRAPSALGVGVVVWLASELMFFAGFFAAWFTLRAGAERWPAEGVELEVARTAAATAVLILSSGTIHLAVAAAHRGDRARAGRWLGVTALLGTVFLANTLAEWAGDGFGIDSHAYGSIFYLLTGFHALHVAGGVLFMGAVAAAVAGRSRAPAGATVEVCAAYWHFVDVVWVAVFLTVYVLS
ncbi:MAG: heme-copper oxidase subunit III [Acidimicrobiia bacterium]|nr:heme-copper oxidase subunit III [Acidimicrobiia bacterium]